MDDYTTRISTQCDPIFGGDTVTPGIMFAYAAEGAATVDRCVVTHPFTVGRSSECTLPLNDDKVSKHHLTITHTSRGFSIEDQDSTNGTFVDGLRLIGKRICPDFAVIRLGREILVFHSDAGPMLSPPPTHRFGMGGPFHSGGIIQNLLESANSKRHVLLTGPSGSGKELAAASLREMLSESGDELKMVDYNAARFTSEEEATSTLFGVGSKVFSNVDPRPGLIEQARGGVLFLDEVHNLPGRVQRTLLRTLEDGQYSRIGESKRRPTHVHFVLASNESAPDFGLAHDLLARLRVVHVPPLKERVADIPQIFTSAFVASLERIDLDAADISHHIGTDHYEAMCLDGFETDNVRGILDLVDRLVSKLTLGVDPKRCIAEVFAERFGGGLVAKRRQKKSDMPSTSTNDVAAEDGATALSPSTAPIKPSSHYDVHRDQIITAYHQCNGNLTATERMLRSAGIGCTRRWLGIYAKKWGLR